MMTNENALAQAYNRIADLERKLAAIREFDITATTSYQRAEDSALESATDYRRGMIYAAELLAALTEAGEGEQHTLTDVQDCPACSGEKK